MNRQNKNRCSLGFTLIEILVVITIIMIISAVGLVSFINVGKNARDARRKSDLETVRQALVLYRSENGCYPNPGDATAIARYLAVIDTLGPVGSSYLSSPLPQDPQYTTKPNTQAYQYSTTGSCGSGMASGFSLAATLENPVSTYTISNP